MFAYVLRKLLLAMSLVLGVVTLAFVFVEMVPGPTMDRYLAPEVPTEVEEQVIAHWALDRPVHVRYVHMLSNLVSGELGYSITQGSPVSDIVAEALPNTLLLGGLSLLVSLIAGVTLGLIQAARQSSCTDASISLMSLFFYSMPSFWLALVLVLVFSVWWPLLPGSGMRDAVMYDYLSPSKQLLDRLRHLVLPCLALGLASSAGLARSMRVRLVEVVRQDFVRTARAKGLANHRVFLGHALRNGLVPFVTITALNLPALLSGSVLVETVFRWPGMGRLMVGAVFAQDTPLIVACFFRFSLLVVGARLLADVFHAVVDPRIRHR